MKEHSSDVMFFPEVITYSSDFQKEHLWRCRYTSTNSKSLHYKILLPLNVKPVSIEPKPIDKLHGFYTIGCYQTIPDTEFPFMEIAVIYEFIKNDIDASEWLDYISLSQGEETIHHKYYYSVSGKYSDILTKKHSDGNVIISRIRAFKNYDFERKGVNLIMVKASCSLTSYDFLAEDLLHCVKFFTLINDSEWHLAEELKSININSPASYSFYHPASWRYTERYNNQLMSYHSLIMKKNGLIHGIIDVYFLCANTAINKEQFCNLLMDKLKKNSYSAANDITLKATINTLNNNIEELWAEELEINNSKSGEFMLVVFAGKAQKNWFYLIGSLTQKKKDFKLWATGKRAINIILNSLNNYDLIYEDAFYEKP
ncbi:hypothetical protein [Trabulsiella odontotermitis]|uniref:Uncharacterized protein n=1 Tax=Trabulsiella odontotermitis TaxID=379893 RepID=A0A0L0GR39_9ENTR|nr:hypothetical protein [Trabulsiella odontotermitis]KNC91324.1 hypothetical protein GM31_01795 [Trabulsiella odontotermitis]